MRIKKFLMGLAFITLILMVSGANTVFAVSAGENASNPIVVSSGDKLVIPGGADAKNLTFIGIMLKRYQPASPNSSADVDYSTPVNIDSIEEWFIDKSQVDSVSGSYKLSFDDAAVRKSIFSNYDYLESLNPKPVHNLVQNNQEYKIAVEHIYRTPDNIDHIAAPTVIYVKLDSSAPSDSVQTDIVKLQIERIYGANRYKTAAAISRKGWERSDTVILASGEDYPDALTAVTLAGLKDAPILLTMGDRLNEDTMKEIERLGAKNIYIIGGTGVIAESIELLLKQKYKVERIYGSDRYKTAVAVGRLVKEKKDIDTVVLCTGLDFPDAMAIAPFAAKEIMTILYTTPYNLNEDTKNALKNWGIKKVIITGGTGVISATVEDYIKNQMNIEVKRLSGIDRYLTSLEIAKYYDSYYDYKSVVIATGEIFADALCGAPFAAKGIYPVLLVTRDEINKNILDYISNLKIERVFILGGSGAVSDTVKEKIR